MPNDGQSSTGFVGTLKSKWGPLPVWGWLALVTVVLLGYWLYEQHKNAAAGTTPAQTTSGNAGQPGVVVINQDEPGTEPPEPPEKKHKHGKKGKGEQDATSREITLDQNETLGQLAKQRHWSADTLREVEQMNLTQGQGAWTPSTKLHKGQVVLRPQP